MNTIKNILLIAIGIDIVVNVITIMYLFYKLWSNISGYTLVLDI